MYDIQCGRKLLMKHSNNTNTVNCPYCKSENPDVSFCLTCGAKIKVKYDWFGFGVRFFSGVIVGAILAFILAGPAGPRRGGILSSRGTFLYTIKYTTVGFLVFVLVCSLIFGLFFGFFYKNRRW